MIHSDFNVDIPFYVLRLRPSQPNGIMSSSVSLPNHTFTGQLGRLSPLSS